ncbi:MAG TPA: hypothetical protein VIE16_10565 [Phenylobacterium sp.]
MSAQEAPPSNADIAAKIIGTVDTNNDSQISLDEVEKALGQDATSGADALGQAFAKVDANGDGQISADELTSALDAKNAASGAPQAQHAHHGRHAHHAASSADLASRLLGQADSDGDGKLSASELSTAIDAFRTAHHHGGGADAAASTTQAVTA